jgi:hypothetical protein
MSDARRADRGTRRSKSRSCCRGTNVSVSLEPHAAPVCEPKQSPPLPAAQGVRQARAPGFLPAPEPTSPTRFAVALQDAKATPACFGAPGNGIGASRRRRPVADGPRILARHDPAAHLAAEAEPPR